MNEPSPEAKQAAYKWYGEYHVPTGPLEAFAMGYDAAQEQLAHQRDIAELVWQWRCEGRLTKQDIVNALDQARAPLVEALRFYAEPENWVDDILGMPDGHSSEVRGSNEVNQDGGMRARAALTGTGEKWQQALDQQQQTNAEIVETVTKAKGINETNSNDTSSNLTT